MECQLEFCDKFLELSLNENSKNFSKVRHILLFIAFLKLVAYLEEDL